MKPWQRLYVDFTAPFLGTSFLVIVDAHSKWPEVFEMSTITTATTIKKLRFLFASFGLPEQIVTDNGSQFMSKEFQAFMKQNGIKHVRCVPYHPSSNGAVECFNQTFKQTLRASEKDGKTLSHCLADFLLTYCSMSHATTNRTPSSLFLGREVRTRFLLIHPDVAKHVLGKQADRSVQHDKHVMDRKFSISQNVMVRNFRPNGPKWIPGTIVRQTDPLSSVVQVGPGLEWKRHVNHLRDATAVNTPDLEHQPRVEPESDANDLPTVPVFQDEPQPLVKDPSEDPPPRRYPLRVRNPPDRYQ